MKHQLDDMPVHIATGGRSFDPAKTVLLFLHGSGQNHLTWVLQSRYFAYRNYAVLAPDFPGMACRAAIHYCRSRRWPTG